MKKLNLFLMLALFGLGMMVQTVEAQISHAPGTAEFGLQGTTGPAANARHAIAPYAQVTANATYTFIGISHPSLDTAHTSIGIAVEALDMVTVPNTVAGRASVFTVNAGETHRVFIVNQSHATINASNSAFTDSKTHLITTSDATQFGSVKVTSLGTSPTEATNTASRPGDYIDASNEVFRLDNISQLAMWGVVYQSSNGAGFALEFIGDMHDSVNIGYGSIDIDNPGDKANHKLSAGGGRGIN